MNYEIKTVHKSDEEYPGSLLRSKYAPHTLYYIGDISIANNCVAVIGKRDVSEETQRVSYLLGKLIASYGYTILNGLAIGCDMNSIEGALSEDGKVITVLPCGLDDIYPVRCKSLSEKILKNGGCLISEYPCGVKPEKRTFVERDKIQAGISKKIFVIYSDLNSGTMHTVKYGINDNKPIGCYMGDNEKSTGNKYFIDNLGAKEIKDDEELIDFLSEEPPRQLSLFDYF